MLKLILKGVLFLIPFILGATGLLLAGESVWDSLFNCVLMYTLNFDNPAPNVLVEIARWTAPLLTASAIAQLLIGFRNRIHNLFIRAREGSTAIYGPENDKKRIEAECGGKVVRTKGFDDFQKADRYVLLGSDAENSAFLIRNKDRLKDRAVYLKSGSWQPLMIEDSRIRVFSVEENAARMFWKQSRLFEDYRKNAQDHGCSIVLIGFGKLGEELLYWGLQFNQFDPKQKIAYHVFPGPDRESLQDFLDLHHSLDRLGDEVVAHPESWRRKENAELLRSAQRVIVIAQENTDRIVQDLLFIAPQASLDVLSEEDAIYQKLENGHTVRVFNWRENALHAEDIFSEKLLAAAKAINLRYEHIYSGVEETSENAERCWKKLNAFLRYSNISAADYHEITRQMLCVMNGIDPDGRSPEEDYRLFEQADGAVRQLFAELEHMRWCSFHFLNNWDYADLEKKDTTRRLHPLLRPFDALSQEEKDKDDENVDRLFRLAAGKEDVEDEKKKRLRAEPRI